MSFSSLVNKFMLIGDTIPIPCIYPLSSRIGGCFVSFAAKE